MRRKPVEAPPKSWANGVLGAATAGFRLNPSLYVTGLRGYGRSLASARALLAVVPHPKGDSCGRYLFHGRS